MAALAREELAALRRQTCGTTTRVDENVHIGGYLAAADPAYVEARGYTHILKLFPDDPSYRGGTHRHPGVQYKVVDADDLPDYPLDRHFAECLQFIQKAIRENGQVLVHCHAGVSRSSTIVILHLMINTGLPLSAAYARLKAARPVINPNPGFWDLLVGIDRRASRFRLEGRAPPRPNLTPAPRPPRTGQADGGS
jgi:protein-tyrosine phosphatase